MQVCYCCFIAVCCCLQTMVYGQQQIIEPISTSLYEGRRVILPLGCTYRLPSFSEGSIIYRNGVKAVLKLNYNIARDEMHFLDEKGDTLIVADPPTINFITINHNQFYYFKGRYMQVVQTNGIITLAFWQEVKVQPFFSDKEIVNAGYFTGNGQRVKLDDGRQVILLTEDHYYFGDNYGNFTKAGRGNLLAYYEKNKEIVSSFIDKHHTNFDKITDLMELFRFCGSLQ